VADTGTVVDVPKLSSGPTPKLAITDPTTLVMIAIGLYAAGSLAWHGATGLAAPPLTLQVTNMIVAALILVGGFVSKHVLTASVLKTVGVDAGTVLTTVNQVLPQPLTPAELLAAAKDAIEALAATVPPKT
jgi:hypothetical protein